MQLLEKDLNELPSGLPGLLHWASAHEHFCVLDGSAGADPDYAFPNLIAVGASRSFELNSARSFAELDDFLSPTPIGYLVQIGYGLKDRIEKLSSRHIDPIGFPDLFVFEPLHLIRFLPDQKLQLQSPDPEALWSDLLQIQDLPGSVPIPSVSFQARCTVKEYLEQLSQVQRHIRLGDCYELNYCQEFFVEDVRMEPVCVYQALTRIVQAPFSCLYRHGSRWLIGASPERFLKKTGEQVESRPMKGTAPRNADPVQDKKLGEDLVQSEKDRSENIMVVDLVRNDLSRVAAKSTVDVPVLCQLHSFPQVHQLVSTVRARLRPEVRFTEIIKACFPMGSMTGAPKVRVMELTDQYECSARGLYSGSVGFIEPNGDFDLNVVIRSLQYESDSGYLSYHVGSGITIYSDPKKEWEECLWKSTGIRKVFGE
jgi:para-aminobenzoate synthetase component 1